MAGQKAGEPANTCPTPRRPKVGGPANPVTVSSRDPRADTIGREVRHLTGQDSPPWARLGQTFLLVSQTYLSSTTKQSCLAPRSRLATSVATGFPQTPFCRRRLGQTLLFAGQTSWHCLNTCLAQPARREPGSWFCSIRRAINGIRVGSGGPAPRSPQPVWLSGIREQSVLGPITPLRGRGP